MEGLLIHLGKKLHVRLGLQMFLSLLFERYHMILST